MSIKPANYPLLALALTLITPACLQAASYDDLKQSSGGGKTANIPAAPVNAPKPNLPGRWPTSAHSHYATALGSDFDPNNKDGDYYPFAKKVGGHTYPNEINDQVYGDPTDLGIIGGMGNESGHPSLFNNGGDPKFYWERALRKFRDGLFAAAYSDIGIICHLTQDQAVPVHAANINHVITFGDKLEAVAGKNKDMIDHLKDNYAPFDVPEMEPYQYYQALQDDTRRHLLTWVNPATNKPYWPPAADAPPLGQDSTKGPWSHYSDRKDTYNKDVSPEILQRQMMMAAVYTKEVLKSAAKRLPPAITDMKAKRESGNKKAPVNLSFKVFDNRKGDIELLITRPLSGEKIQKTVHVESNGKTIPGNSFSLRFPELAAADGAEDVVMVTATDADGNHSDYITKVQYQHEYVDDIYGR